MPGGKIRVVYSDGKTVIAAEAGDYIYPADVRFDVGSNTLYVKASGIPAAFGGPETWLIAYDLGRQKQSEKALVDPDVLPKECSEQP